MVAAGGQVEVHKETKFLLWGVKEDFHPPYGSGDTFSFWSSTYAEVVIPIPSTSPT